MNRLFAAIGRSSALISLAILTLVAAVYWPALSAGFVWDDNYFLHDSAWLSEDWVNTVLHGFGAWETYYRPLGVALFALEARAFHLSPAPMHFMSLGIHLTNTLLVGGLAKRLLSQFNPDRVTVWPIAMLFFGLHPALIEPVTWVSAQYDLLQTFFTLCGIILNLSLRHRATRALSVALCFFLAACSKEAALSFPLLLVIADWLCLPDDQSHADSAIVTKQQQFSSQLQRQWPVYLAVFLAGLAYLSMRFWALGFLVDQNLHLHWSWWQQLQTICFSYLAYWKLLIWPMGDLAPIHAVAESAFAALSPKLLAVDMGALTLLLLGIRLLWRRKLLGGAIVAVTAAVMPALHIVPLRFDYSLYHERYAIAAVAVASAFLPSLYCDLLPRVRAHSIATVWATVLISVTWLAFGAANIRVTIPLWSDEVRLWEWALLKNPGSISAQEFLLTAYLQKNDLNKAQALAKVVVNGEGLSCAGCMLSIVSMNIMLGDEKRATAALAQAKKILDEHYPTRHLILAYILLSGAVAELKQDTTEAEDAYRAATAYEPLNPEGHMRLALLLARTHKLSEARQSAETAMHLFAPDQRTGWQLEFDKALSASVDTAGKKL